MNTHSSSHPPSSPRRPPGASADKTVVTRVATVARTEQESPAGPAEGWSTFLLSGLVSAGIGAMRNLGALVRGLALGLGGLLTGRLTRGGRHLARGVMKLVQLPLDVLLSLGGRVLSALQTGLGTEPEGYRLGAKQRSELHKVFGDSLDYERVRLKVGRLGLLSLPGRSFVLGNTLYAPRNLSPTASVALQYPFHLLIRDMVRVWHYQNGGTDYVCETLWARWFGDGDDWRTALEEGRGWHELDPEQQVRLIQAAYTRSGYFQGPGRRFVDEELGRDYTEQLEAALEQLQTRQGAP